MNKAAKELIAKLAASKNVIANLRSASKPNSENPVGALYAKNRVKAYDAGKSGPPTEPALNAAKLHKDLSRFAMKTASMKNIIDDIIKGASQNTFGRTVNIQQGFDPSPLDIAKFAGALTALSEQGYSVKAAAEYLGLTETQVQHIINAVR